MKPLTIKRTNVSFGPSFPEVKMLRTELLSAIAPGNKWFKLKYNIEEALENNNIGILSFGGAHSNHLYALAASCKKFKLESVGIVHTRSNQTDSHTIQAIRNLGMKVHCITEMNEFNEMKNSEYDEQLKRKFGNFLIIPPGGNNANGLRGAMEILAGVPKFDIIAVPVGYGTTISGLIRSLDDQSEIIGFPAVSKDDSLNHRISAMLPNKQKANWTLNWNYSFGGFGRKDDSLIEFMNDFYLQHSIKLDPIYTGKMMYGIMDLLRNGVLNPHRRILCIHTGGLQGIVGFNQRYPGALIYGRT